MTQTIQPGQHPNADQLSAFAEHALPPHEQQQLLAHLAGCSDCRALVFLAQEAIPAAAILPQPVAPHQPWFAHFSGWKLALPAAAALACLISVTFYLHNKSMETRMNAMADKTTRLEPAPPLASPPPPMQAAPLQTVPEEAPKPSAIAAPAISSLEAAKTPGDASFHGSAQPLGVGGLTGRGAAVATDEFKATTASHQSSYGMVSSAGYAASPPPAPAAAPVVDALAGSLSGALPQGTEIANGTFADRAAVNAPAATRPAASTTAALHSLNQQYSAVPQLPPMQPKPQSQAATPSAAAGTPAGIANVNETVAVTSATAQMETESNASSAVISGAALDSLQSKQARLPENRMAKKQPTLPSRLPVVSTLSNAGHQLALDTAGTLFRSDDAGVTWHPVASQWTGRAIKIALAPFTTSAAKDAISGLAKAASAPPQQFQLTNDAGQLWTSPDGQTWKQK